VKRDSRGNNCQVLGTNADEADFVKRQTPMETKKAEIYNSPEYKTDLNAGFNGPRQRTTTKARRVGSVRPLGGGAAKK
jgi:hypothetical protein